VFVKEREGGRERDRLIVFVCMITESTHAQGKSPDSARRETESSKEFHALSELFVQMYISSYTRTHSLSRTDTDTHARTRTHTHTRRVSGHGEPSGL